MKNGIKDSYEDAFYDLKDSVVDELRDGETLDNAIRNAIDNRLIYDENIFELASHYLNGSDILDMFYEDLFNDLYEARDDFSTTETITLDNGEDTTCYIDNGEMYDEDNNVNLDYDFDATLEDNLDNFKDEYQVYYDIHEDEE